VSIISRRPAIECGEDDSKRADRVKARSALGATSVMSFAGLYLTFVSMGGLLYDRALYIILVPPHISCSFKHPNNGINQKLSDQRPHKVMF